MRQYVGPNGNEGEDNDIRQGDCATHSVMLRKTKTEKTQAVEAKGK
jgi:hypothetical protein